MLREVIDIASLEDFVSGLARAARLRVAVYDGRGELIVASAGNNEFARLTGHVLSRLSLPVPMTPVPAHDPPASVGFVESRGVWYVVAPVLGDDGPVGYLAVGEFRAGRPAAGAWALPDTAREVHFEALSRAWESLPPLDRAVHSHAIVTARWGARQLAEWSHRESKLMAATQEVALVGDIAQLLTGKQDLQSVLDRIVAETARVMRCPYASIRLYDPRTQELTVKAVHNLAPEYVDKGAVVRTASAVSDEALSGRVVYVEDVATDTRIQYPAEARRLGIVSMLTTGLIYRGQPVGVIRVYTDRRRRFRKAQRDLLRAVAYQAATAIVHAQLAEERLRNAETQRQLALAGELQQRMIRLAPPHHRGLQTALAFHPTYEVAGDFCDFLTLADGRLAVLVADVAGKGLPASLLMSSVRGALRAIAETCRGPGELLTRLNHLVYRDTLPSEFLTMLLVAVDAEARRLTYANAGHEPLLLLRDGQVQVAEGADLVLGIRPAEVYHEHELPLSAGDFLLLYTDGVIEARDFSGHEFGRDRLWESLRNYGSLAPEQVLNNIVWDIRRFVGLADQSDDITLVGVRVAPVAPTTPARPADASATVVTDAAR